MKAMTKNLKYFAGTTLIFSVLFFYFLYSDLSINSYDRIWIYATLYGSALFLSGLAFGYHDSIRDTRLDLGFYYHLVTFVIVNAVGLISLFMAMGSYQISLLSGLMPIFFWLLGLLVHYYFSSRSIKGMDRDRIFD